MVELARTGLSAKELARDFELIDRRRFLTQSEARSAIFKFIEEWYNPRRRHSSSGYLSTINFERNQLPPLRPSP